MFPSTSKRVIDLQTEDVDAIEKIRIGAKSSGMMRKALELDIDENRFDIKLLVRVTLLVSPVRNHWASVAL